MNILISSTHNHPFSPYFTLSLLRQPANPFGCPGGQFSSIGDRYGAWSTLLLVYVMRLLLLPLTLSLIALALCASLAFTLLWFPLGLSLVSLRRVGLLEITQEAGDAPPSDLLLLLPMLASLMGPEAVHPLAWLFDAVIFGAIVLAVLLMCLLQLLYLPLGLLLAAGLVCLPGAALDGVTVLFWPMILLLAVLESSAGEEGDLPVDVEQDEAAWAAEEWDVEREGEGDELTQGQMEQGLEDITA